MSIVSIAFHNDLSYMTGQDARDPKFKDIMLAIALGKKEEPFNVQGGFPL